MRKSQPLLIDHENSLVTDDAGTESYSSNTDSFSESYSDGSEVANWEEYVGEDGTLFYAEYIPQTRKQVGKGERRIEFTRNSSLRSGKKTSRRQDHYSKPGCGHQQRDEFKFSNISLEEDNSKVLELVITAADRFRFGRRSTAAESILGLRVVPFTDQPECLMVDGFVHDMPALLRQGEQLPVVRGDWLKSLDGIEIRTSNIDELLLQFAEPVKVCLKFQGRGAQKSEHSDEEIDAGELKKIENFAQFTKLFRKIQLPADTAGQSETQTSMIFGLLILPPECYQNEEHRNSLYYYPDDTNSNFLYKARGSFLTLNTVLTEELKTKPSVSRLTVEEVDYFVCYRNMNGFLVLFSFPCALSTLSESNLRADELISYMCFVFPSINLENINSTAFREFLHHICDIQCVRLLANQRKEQCLFEELFSESRHMPLPKEAQLRIFDALSEMEAMDYRSWNDEPLNTHREFFIYGSVLYYDHFLLASQMPLEMRMLVEVFLRCRGVFDFVAGQNVKELYIWEEIALPNAAGRYFLSVCTRGHLILAVILKIFDASDIPVDGRIEPSLFYIEEIQETLDHLVQCGIESLATFWSVSNKRPEVLDKLLLQEDALGSEKDSSRLETFLKQKLTTSSPNGSKEASSTSAHCPRGPSNDTEEAPFCPSLGGSSVQSFTLSEEDSCKRNMADDSDSGSDWDNFAEQTSLHHVFDSDMQSEVTESLWKEIKNVVPIKISAGWKNALYYYVYVDEVSGSTFCPLKSNSEKFPFLREMRVACHIIRNVLQHTKSCRREFSSGTVARDSTLIKEHGITIQVGDPGECSEDVNKGFFVVVGRLFFAPYKEVYVCHRPDVPQNMVEMAFRLSFFSVG